MKRGKLRSRLRLLVVSAREAPLQDITLQANSRLFSDSRLKIRQANLMGAKPRFNNLHKDAGDMPRPPDVLILQDVPLDIHFKSAGDYHA